MRGLCTPKAYNICIGKEKSPDDELTFEFSKTYFFKEVANSMVKLSQEVESSNKEFSNQISIEMFKVFFDIVDIKTCNKQKIQKGICVPIIPVKVSRDKSESIFNIGYSYRFESLPGLTIVYNNTNGSIRLSDKTFDKYFKIKNIEKEVV